MDTKHTKTGWCLRWTLEWLEIKSLSLARLSWMELIVSSSSSACHRPRIIVHRGDTRVVWFRWKILFVFHLHKYTPMVCMFIQHSQSTILRRPASSQCWNIYMCTHKNCPMQTTTTTATKRQDKIVCLLPARESTVNILLRFWSIRLINRKINRVRQSKRQKFDYWNGRWLSILPRSWHVRTQK